MDLSNEGNSAVLEVMNFNIYTKLTFMLLYIQQQHENRENILLCTHKFEKIETFIVQAVVCVCVRMCLLVCVRVGVSEREKEKEF